VQSIVGQGESSLNPQLSEMMEYLSGKSIKVEFTTNGSIFDHYLFDEILSWNIDMLGVSVDGLDKVSYEEIRKNGNYINLRNNIQEFYTYKKARNRKYPLICIRNVIFPFYTQHQINDFKAKWYQISDMITFNTLISFEERNPVSAHSRCKELFFEAHIRYDGSVLLCQYQFLWGKNEIIGNIKESSLRDIWQVERLREMRLLHRNKDFPDTCRLCHNTNTRDIAYCNSRKYNSSRNRLQTLMNKVINMT
jgi:radical SAM protein with 4Fe4S-binding SPASM domain